MRQASKESADFNRITQILRKQQGQPLLPQKTKFISQMNNGILNQKTDRKSQKRFSPSPKRNIKKESSLKKECSLNKKESSLTKKSKRKEFEQKELELKTQIKEAEKLVATSQLTNLSDLQGLFIQMSKVPSLKSLFTKLSDKCSFFFPSQENSSDLLQTFILRQNKQNSDYLYEQLQLLMQENENLKIQIGHSRKERLDRMRHDELLLEQMRLLNLQSKKKEVSRIDLEKVKTQKGFHQEFMDQMQQFSESWRNLAKEQ